MKYAAMVVEMANGKLDSVPATSVVGLLQQARTIRDSGKFKDAAAKCGVVFGVNTLPFMQLRCEGPAQIEARLKAEKAEAKAKAEKK